MGAVVDGSLRIDAAAKGIKPTRNPRLGVLRARSAARLIALAALLGTVATLFCAGLGFGLARASDDRAATRQRAALRENIAAFRSLAGEANEIAPRFVRMIEQSVQLKGLKFETDPAATARETQPVINGQGRIIGFFTWEQERPMTQMMKRLVPLIGGLVAALLGFAAFSVWQLRRVRHEPIAREEGAGAIIPARPVVNPIMDDEQFIRRELPLALAAGELSLHYQPIVSAQGARIVGVEALLRWTHPDRGAIGPALFIPVAEKMGLIDKVGAFVLRRALEQAKRWPDLYMGVNLSPLQVRDSAIVDLVRDTLAQTGIEPSRLMLEITEGVLIDNPDEMLQRIADLHDIGVRIALDDFGSGYSNLGYLQRFPIDKLKIDRSFVTALGPNSNGGVIVQAITALGRALGVSVLAEGVETEEQRVLLRLAGCSEMQGYLFAKPGPAFTIDRLLALGNARLAPAQAALTLPQALTA